MTEHHVNALPILLMASLRAGELRHEAVGETGLCMPILRGAPTHSGAFLLSAIDELGWKLVPTGEVA